MARSSHTRGALLLISLLAASGGCSGDDSEGATQAPSSEPARVHGLTAEQASAVAAVVGETTITAGEVAEALDEQSPYLRARYTTPERKREFLDHLVELELLVEEATRRGYRDRPEVIEARREALITELLRVEVDETLDPSSIDDAAVRAFYESHPEDFHQPEQMRASHILFADRAAATRALRRLRAAQGDMALFRRLATELSADAATKAQGGDLRFFSRPPEDEAAAWSGPPRAVARAAFTLTKNGDVYDEVVESRDGFHVVARGGAGGSEIAEKGVEFVLRNFDVIFVFGFLEIVRCIVARLGEPIRHFVVGCFVRWRGVRLFRFVRHLLDKPVDVRRLVLLVAEQRRFE